MDFSDMGFVIKKILVHQEWSPVTTNQVHYNMDRTSWDVRNLLEVKFVLRLMSFVILLLVWLHPQVFKQLVKQVEWEPSMCP